MPWIMVNYPVVYGKRTDDVIVIRTEGCGYGDEYEVLQKVDGRYSTVYVTLSREMALQKAKQIKSGVNET